MVWLTDVFLIVFSHTSSMALEVDRNISATTMALSRAHTSAKTPTALFIRNKLYPLKDTSNQIYADFSPINIHALFPKK